MRFARIWGLEIEPVKILQILPADSKLVESPLPSGRIDGFSPIPSPTAVVIPTPATVYGRVGKITRPVPSVQIPWGIRTVYNDSTILKTSGGDKVTVAVLDTGALITHPDLKNRVAKCVDFTNPKLAIVDGKCEDKNGHGTHVAGIVAADGGADGKGIFGVAPETKLFIYKVCNASGTCYADDIATALRTAAKEGANIVNMSFGSDLESGLITDAINFAISQNVLPIAAAGNDGPYDNSIDYPAAKVSVVAVAALNSNLDVTEWSSRGINSTTEPYVVEEGDIELALPGENIESTWNNNGYVILSGTSMASPFAAGLAAKYWQADATNPAEATREFLHKLAVDIKPTGDDNGSGFGLSMVKDETVLNAAVK